jgi:hypothetical protein
MYVSEDEQLWIDQYNSEFMKEYQNCNYHFPEYDNYLHQKISIKMFPKLTRARLKVMYKRMEQACKVAGVPIPKNYTLDLFKSRLQLNTYWNGKLVNIRTKEHTDSADEFLRRLKEHYPLSNRNRAVTPITQKLDKIQMLSIGMWGEYSDFSDATTIIEWLSTNSKILPFLKAIYLGDIEQNELEVSWIYLSDITPAIVAYPNLNHWQSKGMAKLQLTPFIHHHLSSFVLVTGGLRDQIIRNLWKCKLTNLSHLEIWLGTEEYGADWNVETFEPFFTPEENGIFPKLQYLGLRNASNINSLCGPLVQSSVAKRIRVIDLSLGELGNVGAQELLKLNEFSVLELLELGHHCIDDQDILNQLELLPCIVDLRASEDASRYVVVAE